MPSHFIVQITENGGPDPAQELQGLLNQSQISISQHVAWFKSTLTDNQFELSGRSICIIFRRLSNTDAIEAIVARVLTRNGFPAPDTIVDFYQSYQNLGQFWRLGGQRTEKNFPDLVRTRFQNLDQIPGVSVSGGLPASETFDCQSSMAFWEFPDDQFNPLNWLQSFHQKSNSQTDSVNHMPSSSDFRNLSISSGNDLDSTIPVSLKGEPSASLEDQEVHAGGSRQNRVPDKAYFESRCEEHSEKESRVRSAFDKSDDRINERLRDLLVAVAKTCFEYGLSMETIQSVITKEYLER